MRSTLLTIAGTDPSAGAGIQVDLQVFRDFGFHGLSVVTAVVAQNTRDVRSFEPVPRVHIGDQIETLLDDMRPAVVKIGMVPTADAAEVIGGKLPGFQGADSRPVVYDPVLASGSGASRLVRRGTRPALVNSLIPKVDWLMPNLMEAQDLLETAVSLNTFSNGTPTKPPSVDNSPDAVLDEETSETEPTSRRDLQRLVDSDLDSLTRRDAEAMASYLCDLGPSGVILTGGHLAAARDRHGVSDLLVTDGRAHWCDALSPIDADVRGTGCQLSSAFSARLADQRAPTDALEDARAYLNNLLHHHAEYIGTGRPVIVRSSDS